MCSIFGYISKDSINNSEKLNTSSLKMKHRGPDNSDSFLSNDKKTFFAHNRLAIIDLKEESNQPFITDKYVIVFNGEIYNYQELRKKYLKGYSFRTDSDTETIVTMYEKFGKECVRYFNGMFAFCIYDKEKELYFCARDRLGEKPFFYSSDSDKFIFASELGPVLDYVDNSLCKEVEDYYFSSFKSLPAPYTYYKNIKRLKPASYIIVKDLEIIEESFYWHPEVGNYKKIKPIELRLQVIESIRRTAVSDVPISVLLSGGIDSSIIAYVLKKELNIDFIAYTFGKNENDEEFRRAKLVADTLGIELKKIYFEADDLSIHKELIKSYKEPFYLMPIIFAYKLYEQIAKDGIKVVLSGNGADEIFFGYRSHPRTLLFSYLNKFLLRQKSVDIKSRRMGVDHNIFGCYQNVLKQFENSYYIDFSNFFALFLEGSLPMTMIGDICGMAHSVEVRNPFFDHALVEYAYNIHPSQKIGSLFDKQGIYTKKILKDAFKDDLPKEVLEAKKVGFGESVREDSIFGHNGVEKFAKWAMDEFLKDKKK